MRAMIAPPTMSPRLLLVRRTAAQLLDRRIGGGPEVAVRALLAVQAQDKGAWRLALRARVEGIAAADVDAALTERRSLTVAWLNRGTLHLIASEDYPWLWGLTAPTQATAVARRLAQLGFSPDDVDRGVDVVERALLNDGPLPRSELRERVAARGLPTAGQAMVHLLFATVNRGLAVLGPVVGGEHAFAHTREWLGVDPGRLAGLAGKRRDIALAELSRRYLQGHGPATDADLARWAGLPLRDARSGLRAVAAELVELEGGLVDLADRDPSAFELEARWRSEPLPPRLLPGFDPCLLGWRDRAPFVTRTHEPRVIPPGGGVFRAIATVDGVAAATWGVQRRADRIAVRIEPFEPLDPAAQAALRAEAEDVARFESRSLIRG
jgi:Winged helix DNA-binding domain